MPEHNLEADSWQTSPQKYCVSSLSFPTKLEHFYLISYEIGVETAGAWTC